MRRPHASTGARTAAAPRTPAAAPRRSRSRAPDTRMTPDAERVLAGFVLTLTVRRRSARARASRPACAAAGASTSESDGLHACLVTNSLTPLLTLKPNAA